MVKAWAWVMKQMTTKRLLILLFVLGPITLLAQPINDFGTWWGIEIKKKVHRDIKIAVCTEARLRENSSELKNFYIEPSVKYSPLNWLEIGFQYRFDNRYQREGSYFNFRHRLGLDIEFICKKKRIELGYRNRTQLYWEDEFDSDITYPIMANRNQINASYKWPNLPFKTKLNAEIWIPLELNAEINRFRVTVDQAYTLKTKHHFHLRFIYQTNLDPTIDGLHEFILSTRYVFDF